MRAAAVKKEDTLLSPFNIFKKLCAERRTDASLIPDTELIFKINDPDLRKLQLIVPFAQHKSGVSADFRMIPRLEIRCGRPKHEQAATLVTAKLGDIFGIIPGIVFGPIGIFLFLIYNKDTQILHRSKNRTACTDGDMGPPGFQPFPLVITLAGRQGRMQNRNIISEIGRKRVEHLRRERDFRHKKNGGSAPFQCGIDQADIDARFAAARNTFQQGNGSFSGGSKCIKPLKSSLLLLVENRHLLPFSRIEFRNAENLTFHEFRKPG